jgi:hypothetical protein
MIGVVVWSFLSNGLQPRGISMLVAGQLSFVITTNHHSCRVLSRISRLSISDSVFTTISLLINPDPGHTLGFVSDAHVHSFLIHGTLITTSASVPHQATC